MFKSIRRHIYQISAVLFLVVQSWVFCPLLAVAVPIAQVNSSPSSEQQQPTSKTEATEQPQPEGKAQQPPPTATDKETAKDNPPYDMNVIKQFDDELYGK